MHYILSYLCTPRGNTLAELLAHVTIYHAWPSSLSFYRTNTLRGVVQPRHHALRPGTWANHRSHLKKFLAFCLQYHQNPFQCDINTILAFTQSLVQQNMTAHNINNYLSSLKTCFTWMKCNGPLLATPEWRWNIQSIPRVIRDPPILRASMEWGHLRLLCLLCFDNPARAVLRVFITFAYYGLFRISNLVPHSKQGADPTRCTLIRDVLPSRGGLQVLIKWTKSRQASPTFALIPLPALDDHYMCPTQAWEFYKRSYPQFTQSPDNLLLADPDDPYGFLTASQARQQLHQLCDMAQLTHRGYTPHGFRRGGAAFLFNQGIPTQAIQHHGLWASSAVELYLRENFPSTSPVVQCFQQNS